MKHDLNSVSPNTSLFSNAQKIGEKAKGDVMIYPSGLITGKVVKNQSGSGRSSSKANTVLNYTKHYYAGSQRVASKTGVRAKNLGHYYPDYIIQHYFPNLDENSIRGPSNDLVDQAGETLQSVFGEFGITQAIPNPVDDGVVPRFIYTQKRQIFYFHPDQLGSSNYITNLNGNISQHMEYLPFGETLVEEHKNSNNSPYKFNAKELDEETGNYYYGARYYDPKFSMWLSVDPKAEKRQGWSPYSYVQDNPLNRIDPSGALDESVQQPDDWYKNEKTGRVLWFDRKDLFFSNKQGDWSNVGTNLSEVKNVMNVPENSTKSWNSHSAIAFGGGDSKGTFMPVVINNTADFRYSLNVKNNENGLINGKSEITGVNMQATLTSRTGASGIYIYSVKGSLNIPGFKGYPSAQLHLAQ